MQITPKLGEALQLAVSASSCTLTRCGRGFHDSRTRLDTSSPYGIVTRRTANQLANAGLATYNDRTVPSAITLTAKGVEQARACDIRALEPVAA